MGRGQPDRMTGVGETFQSVHQHRAAAVGRHQLGRREFQLIHARLPWLVVRVVWILIVGHRFASFSGAYRVPLRVSDL